MTYDEIAAYLQGQGVGTIGADLFAGVLPALPDKVVTIMEGGGSGAMMTMDSVGVDLEKPSLGIWSRAGRDDYAFARSKAEDAYKALGKISNQTLGSTFYLSIELVQTPFLMQRDENDRPIIAFNVNILKQPS